MKRMVMIVVLVATVATPAAAQWLGMPVWNNPKGGTGITVNGDVGIPNSDWGKGTAFGARASLGLANITLTAGLASWKPDGPGAESVTGFGGNAAFRIIGGSLIPVSLNLQVGAARHGAANLDSATTRVTAGGGIAVSVPTPGLSIEPYLSLTNRWYKESGISGTESNFGWTLGANVNFGMLGAHLAYDSESAGSGVTGGIFGLGVHVALKAPIGM
jgi:opacity protein-like surface antigen